MPGNLFDLKTTGGKRKGGGGGGSSILGKIMGVMGGGGSAAVNPEVTNLSKYGEFGNIAGDYDKPQFVPSGNDAMGQSSQQADELNNRYHISKIMAKYNDTLARGALPFQTDEAIRQGQTLDKSRAALAQETAANAKQSKGEDYYRGLESLTDQERQMMFPNNPEVMWEDFGKLAGRMETTYPQVAQEGLRGILAKLPKQQAGFNFDASPEGQAMHTAGARAIAGRPELDNRIANRVSLPNGMVERIDWSDPNSASVMFEGRRDITSEENVALPQTQLQIDAKAPVEYTKMQRHTSVAPNITARGRTMNRTEEEYDAFRNSNDTDYNQAIRAQPEAQQPAGISGTPTGDKAPPPQVISAQPQVAAQQYEGLLPSLWQGSKQSLANVGSVSAQAWNDTASNMAAIAPSGSDAANVLQQLKMAAIKAANSDLRKILIRAKGENVDAKDPLSGYLTSLQDIVNTGGDIGRAGLETIMNPLGEILNGAASYVSPAFRATTNALPFDKSKRRKLSAKP